MHQSAMSTPSLVIRLLAPTLLTPLGLCLFPFGSSFPIEPLLQIRDHLSKIPSEDSSEAFCGVENGFVWYLIHSCMGYHRNSASAQRRKSRQTKHELMTPSVSIYLTTHTLLKMRSIHTSFNSSTCQRTMREERGTNATHQPFPHICCCFCCCCCLSVGHRSLLTLFPLLLALYLFLANFSSDVCRC